MDSQEESHGDSGGFEVNAQANVVSDSHQEIESSNIIVKVYSESAYQNWMVCTEDTNDTPPDVILDDIFRRYAGAWKTLAEM
jgi:hypothetical protein